MFSQRNNPYCELVSNYNAKIIIQYQFTTHTALNIKSIIAVWKKKRQVEIYQDEDLDSPSQNPGTKILAFPCANVEYLFKFVRYGKIYF